MELRAEHQVNDIRQDRCRHHANLDHAPKVELLVLEGILIGWVGLLVLVAEILRAEDQREQLDQVGLRQGCISEESPSLSATLRQNHEDRARHMSERQGVPNLHLRRVDLLVERRVGVYEAQVGRLCGPDEKDVDPEHSHLNGV